MANKTINIALSDQAAKALQLAALDNGGQDTSELIEDMVLDFLDDEGYLDMALDDDKEDPWR